MRILFVVLSLLPFYVLAQENPKTPAKKKALCNPLVLGSIPKKALSLQYEYQTAFDNSYTLPSAFPSPTFVGKVNNVQSMKIGYFKNLVTKPKTYITLDAGYWLSQFNADNNIPGVFHKDLFSQAFHSVTASANIFKPLDQKHFILINTSLELNGNSSSFKSIGAKNIFAGGAAIYGWKKGFSSMTGVGVLRAYRLGRAIHLPAFLMNKTFNKKWGVEMLLPARALVRYTANKKNIFTTGFDIEGGQFAFSSSNNNLLNNSFLQRGEIRPKIGWETALNNNTRLTLNTGVRFNGRLDLADNYDGKDLIMENNPKTNLFVNVGLNVLSLKGKKK